MSRERTAGGRDPWRPGSGAEVQAVTDEEIARLRALCEAARAVESRMAEGVRLGAGAVALDALREALARVEARPVVKWGTFDGQPTASVGEWDLWVREAKGGFEWSVFGADESATGRAPSFAAAKAAAERAAGLR